MTSAPPETPEEVGARARAYAAKRRAETVAEQAPSDEPDPATALRLRFDQWEASLDAPDYEPIAKPWRAVPDIARERPRIDPSEPWESVVGRCAAACARFHDARTLHPMRARVAPAAIELPDLIEGAAASERRTRMGRLGALLAESTRLLAGEPEDVVARARRALGRAA